MLLIWSSLTYAAARGRALSTLPIELVMTDACFIRNEQHVLIDATIRDYSTVRDLGGDDDATLTTHHKIPCGEKMHSPERRELRVAWRCPHSHSTATSTGAEAHAAADGEMKLHSTLRLNTTWGFVGGVCRDPVDLRLPRDMPLVETRHGPASITALVFPVGS
ncbi:hypothetical protein NUW58_g10618 [Xylaria curta]|uniref:Uncharacterized protein n=1 Tax=Xylaria curta TaxID=42375 RepID=A0ACC1MIH4_9PEZI|nr:hypothetical protein NUW58_g10618 [Xylaria curta]